MEQTTFTTESTLDNPSLDQSSLDESSLDESSLIEAPESQEFTLFLELPRSEQRSAVEALIFASEEPLTTQMLYDVLIAPSLAEPIKPEKSERTERAERTKPTKAHKASNGIHKTINANVTESESEQSTDAELVDGGHHAGNGSVASVDAFDDTSVEVARLSIEPPKGYIEFAKDNPDASLTQAQEADVLEPEPTFVTERRQHLALIDALVEEINTELHQTGRAFRIVSVAAQADAKPEKNETKGDKASKEAAPMGYQFATTAKHGELLSRLVKSKSKKRLSQAALETLAIVAYRQPVSKPELEVIRGVNSGEVMNKLLEKNLVTIVGRAETVGKPLLYGTTDEFLRLFGLHSLDGLPKPRELEELMENRADIIEAIQTAKEAAATVVSGTKNTLTDTMPERTMEEIALDDLTRPEA